jgi:hypothetical protein
MSSDPTSSDTPRFKVCWRKIGDNLARSPRVAYRTDSWHEAQHEYIDIQNTHASTVYWVSIIDTETGAVWSRSRDGHFQNREKSVAA